MKTFALGLNRLIGHPQNTACNKRGELILVEGIGEIFFAFIIFYYSHKIVFIHCFYYDLDIMALFQT